LSTKKVLLIEDEDDIREIATLSLEAVAGWQVQGANSGEEGIRIAKSFQPDAILLDVMMPDMDGPSTLQNLRNDAATQTIPVIFMTAKVQAMDRQRLSRFGAQGIISKPFDPVHLSREVSDILGWK
jgi:DNA-binding response OmpR family regulator